jgi:hypothetical protein
VSPASQWARGAALVLAASACGGSAKDVPVKPAPPPVEARVEAPRKPGGLPGTLSDLEIFLRRPDLDRSMRAWTLFRLAALKEDSARDEMDEDLKPPRLEPSIEIYRRILREFPEFEERAAIHYFLGHALADTNRLPESQQVFRALACQNHHPTPVTADPADPSRDRVSPLPQDHDEAFWRAWEARHPKPIDKPPKAASTSDDEIRFVDPFPADCEPIAPLERARRYLGEVWLRIGDFYFEELDPAAGPYSMNRAASAYRHALRFGVPPVTGIALYKLAWTHFKQQRYEAAIQRFVELLRHMDAEQARTGDPGADFRKEAATYIAGSLTYVADVRRPRGSGRGRSVRASRRCARYGKRPARGGTKDAHRRGARRSPVGDSSIRALDARYLRSARARIPGAPPAPQRDRGERAVSREMAITSGRGARARRSRRRAPRARGGALRQTG